MSEQHFFEKNYSLTEWFEQIESYDVATLRQEDNTKRDRLSTLNQVIGLPFDKPYNFTAIEVDLSNPEFQNFVQQHGDELCAIRLVPLDPTLPKLRIRGKSIRESVDWFNEQTLEKEKYKVEFVPHADSFYASIFVVNEHGVFGELVQGPHSILTQGNSGDEDRLYFSFDFTNWNFVGGNEALQNHAREITEYLVIERKETQQELTEKLNATFAHNYLCGYFETSYDPERGVWFIDYNRILGKDYQLLVPLAQSQESFVLQGQIGNTGKVQGTVRIVAPKDIATTSLTSSDILVCDVTDPSYLPLMKQAGGFITNRGGILSHAAIVARELGKPCIVGTKDATEKLQNGDRILLDAVQGTVNRI